MQAALLNTLLGIWIMLAPDFLGYNQWAANNNYIVGPLEITFAIVAIWEVNRSARYGNLALGTWLVLSPLMLDFDSNLAAIWNNVISGALIALLSLSKGTIKRQYGGGWRSLWH